MQAETHYCPVCNDETAFEAIDCADGHGAQCPDRLCAVCGAGGFAMDWTVLGALAPSQPLTGVTMRTSQWPGRAAA
jgi:hypothetical protein